MKKTIIITLILICFAAITYGQKVIPSSPAGLGTPTGTVPNAANSCTSPQVPILFAAGPSGTSTIILCLDPNTGYVGGLFQGGINVSSIITGSGTPVVGMTFSVTAPSGSCTAGVYWYADATNDLKKYTCINGNWLADSSSGTGSIITLKQSACVSNVAGSPCANLAAAQVYPVTLSNQEQAGDTNVIIVMNATSTLDVSSITDSAGNVYVRGTNTINGGTGANSMMTIWYASNIATIASNTITVNFNGVPVNPIVTALEYSGVSITNSVDISQGASGTSTTWSTGANTTTNSSDLLIGGEYGYYSYTTGSVNSGWSLPIVPQRNNTLIAHQLNVGTGSYTLSGSNSASGNGWVAQYLSLKANTATLNPIPHLVQVNACSTGNGPSSANCSFSSATGAGDLVAVGVSWSFNSGSPVTVTSLSDVGDNCTNAGTGYVGSTGATQILYCYNVQPHTQFTVTFSAATVGTVFMYMAEYSNIPSGNPYDTSAFGSGSGATLSTGNMTTSTNNELLFAVGLTTGNTPTAGTGYTSRNTLAGNILEDGCTDTNTVLCSAGTHNATANSTNGTWNMAVAAFK